MHNVQCCIICRIPVVYDYFTPFLKENSVCILGKGTDIFYFKTQNSLSLLLSVSSYLYLAELEYLAIKNFFSTGKALFTVQKDTSTVLLSCHSTATARVVSPVQLEGGCLNF